MINKLKEKYTRGFTLVETLVAVLLLSVAIAGPLTVASRAFSASVVAKEQVIAYYLAQDALEYVRFKRDSNCLASGTAAPCQPGITGNQWLSGLGACTTGTCKVDSFANTVSSCVDTDATDCLLNYDSNATARRFTHNTGTGIAATKFKRYVNIGVSPTNGNNEALVTVTVVWNTPGASGVSSGISCGTGARCVILKETLFNWQ